ncbi:MAG: glutathione S-transferase [Pseudomonadales bacterium]
MLILHGMARSNYYCMAKACLLEKGLDFEEAQAVPSQEESYLELSPMGKVPCLQTEQGYLSETYAIADYLELVRPEPRLLPADPFARAKTIELVRHLELDVELVARRCLPAAFFGQTASEETKTTTRRDLKRGMRALRRLVRCDPWIAGNDFTLADIYAFYTFGLASAIVKAVLDDDLLGDAPELHALMALAAQRDSIAEIEAAKQA